MSKFVHQELHTPDPASAKKFYAALFGWTYQDMPMPEGVYTMISSPDGGIGGLSEPAPGVEPGWLGYVEVASVDATLRKVVANGGTFLLPKQDVMGMGFLAWYADPQGLRFAVWEAVSPPASASKKAAKKAGKKAGKKAAKKPAKKAAKKAGKKVGKKAPKKAAKKAGRKGRRAG